MGTFGWTVVGSIAGAACAIATILFGIVSLMRRRRAVPPPAAASELLPVVDAREDHVVAGDIPREPLGFQPRTDLLAALGWRGAGSRVVVVYALTGMRGVGKTHLAAAYARVKLADRWRLVAWVNAENAGTLLAGLADVAAAWGLEAADAEAAGRAVRHRLETNGHQCLLVFDNVTDPELVQPFLPVSGESQVLITSNQQAVTYLGQGLAVDVFSKPEALAFLAVRTGRADDAGAQMLAAELGYLPLALAQAAAVIESQHLSYVTYMDRLRRMPVADMLPPDEAGQYRHGIAAAVLLSLDSVRVSDETGACPGVMNLLAVLSAAGVSRSLVYVAGQAGLPGRDQPVTGLSPEVMDRALARLAGASLLTFSLDGSAVSAHRLVMRVIREDLAASNSLMAVRETAAQLLKRRAESLRNTWHEDRATVRDLVEQIIALSESPVAGPADSDLGVLVIRLRMWAVWFLNKLRDSAPQAILISMRLVKDQKQVLGPDHRDTLMSQGDLAFAYWDAGRTDEAIALHEQTLADQERVLGPDHRDTLMSRANMALAYWSAGRRSEAITLLEQTLADRERVLGPDHRDTLMSRNNLGNAYLNAGRKDEAIALYEQTLADRERVLGPDHPDTLQSRHNLAVASQDASPRDEAITLLEQTLAGEERALGPNHPDTQQSRENLALAYWPAGRRSEAIALLEQTLADRERVLGPDHRDTLLSRNNLGYAYRGTGRAGEAIAVHEQTLADQERVLGPDHRDTLLSRNNLALAYRDAGRRSEAIALLEQTLADRERVLGSDHRETQDSRGNLGCAYRDAGRTDEAIALLEQTLADRERVLGLNQPDTLGSRNNLAAAYWDAGRRSEAIALLEQTLADRERVLGPDHPDTLSSRNNLAAAYRDAKGGGFELSAF